MEYYCGKNLIRISLTSVLIVSIFSFGNAEKYNSNFFDSSVYEDSILKTPELIRKYNYPVEVHEAITDDGYILEIHRIPNPGKQPVYLQHGLASSSAEYVFYGPNNALAFTLYDEGYDVWIGNHRGNRYSQRHIKLKNNNIKFWKFSLTELGKYDTKAFIDYVINSTKFEKIHYIGNSQGCAVIFILCDDSPNYSDKLIGIQALAPAIYVKHLKSPIAKLAIYIINRLPNIISLFQGKALPNMADLGYSAMFGELCHDGSPTQEICGFLLSLTVGFNMKETNKTMLPVLLNHFPSGASIMQILHFKQMQETGEFKKYDYGRRDNLRIYKKLKPPFFNIKKTMAKVSVYHSSNDALVVNEDVDKFYNQLSSPIQKVLYDDYNFNHINFIAGTHLENFYNKYLIKTMKLLDNEL